MSNKLEKYHRDIKEIDEYIQRYSDKIQKLKENKKMLEEKIKKIIINNNLTNRNINITSTHSSIRLVTTEKRENITQKFVKNCLIDFFSNRNKEINADTIFNFILNSRKLSKIQELKVKANKK